MAYEKKIWVNREVEKPRTYTIQNNPDGTITLIPAPGAIIAEGTPLVAENFNNIEDGINEAIAKADQAFQSASDGKISIAGAVTGKGVPTSPDDTFQQMAGKINSIVTDPSGDATSEAADILKGKIAYSKFRRLVGSLELTGTTVDANVLAGTTYYNTDPKTKRTGGMANIGSPQITLTNQGDQYNLSSGYYTGGFVKVMLANLVAGNIKAGVNIGGVVGTFTGLIESGTTNMSVTPSNMISKFTLPISFTPKTIIATCSPKVWTGQASDRTVSTACVMVYTNNSYLISSYMPVVIMYGGVDEYLYLSYDSVKKEISLYHNRYGGSTPTTSHSLTLYWYAIG